MWSLSLGRDARCATGLIDRSWLRYGSVTYSSIAAAQDSTEEQQKFGYSEWVLLNGNLTLDNVRSQFKVALQSEEQRSSTA